MTNVVYKACNRCRAEKPPGDFYRDRATKDGLQRHCKECNRAQSSAWAKAHPERMTELQQRWERENPERRREMEREQLERHPEKVRARRRVSVAVNEGKLVKPNRCEDCGDEIRNPYDLHGHHADYDKPLEVEWLCRKCHRGRHGV